MKKLLAMLFALTLVCSSVAFAGCKPADAKKMDKREIKDKKHSKKDKMEEIMKLQKLTPNLVVRDVETSMEFYCRVLGFQRGMTVPEQAPYIFGSVTHGAVEIFFNEQKAVAADHPALGGRPAGGALTLYIEVQGIDELFKTVQQHGVKITMPMKEQFYGMKEFGMEDPEGWELTFAERIR